LLISLQYIQHQQFWCYCFCLVQCFSA